MKYFILILFNAFLLFIFISQGTFVQASILYQDFEPNNGTPAKPASDSQDPEYGWAFNEADARLSLDGEPVQAGLYSWRVGIPFAEKLDSGSGIASQTQTYNMNFIPECFDRLTFWIYSEPLHPGAHTVMVKFFDHGKYHDEGVGVWTAGKAAPNQWVRLEILFDQLPADFDLAHVDKIEFFNYWDGIYYYDDILIASAQGEGEDAACLETEGYVVCHEDPLRSDKTKSLCVSVYSGHGEQLTDYSYIKSKKRLRIFDRLQSSKEKN